MSALPARSARSAATSGLASLLLVGVGACASRGAPVEAPVELAVAPISGAAPKPSPATGPLVGSDGRCSVKLVAGRIEKSSPGCYFDEHISESPGILYYPCGGDGPAEADFGAHRYAGRVTGGAVEVALETELDWEDGCRWGTKALIKGKLVSNGGQVSKGLSWSYRDHVITGTACSGVCIAKSSLHVTSTPGRGQVKPSLRHEDEDDDEEEEDGD